MAERDTVRLSPPATQLLLQSVQSWRQGRLYLLFEETGDTRKRFAAVVYDWREAVEAAFAEGLVIYNARSHKVCRPVVGPNVTFEQVRVRLHAPTYMDSGLVGVRKFVYGGEDTWE